MAVPSSPLPPDRTPHDSLSRDPLSRDPLIQDSLEDADQLPEIEQGDVTRLLQHLGTDQFEISEELIARIYSELRQLASYQLRSERHDHTLQPTALVNEAYLRLIKTSQWASRGHFFRVAAKVMRQVLVDHARARRAKKRGGDSFIVQLDQTGAEPVAPQGRSADDLIALDESLSELARRDPRQAQIVELRFFAGLSETEVCEALNIAPRTARRDWNFARAWLYGQLKRSAGATG